MSVFGLHFQLICTNRFKQSPFNDISHKEHLVATLQGTISRISYSRLRARRPAYVAEASTRTDMQV